MTATNPTTTATDTPSYTLTPERGGWIATCRRCPYTTRWCGSRDSAAIVANAHLANAHETRRTS